MYSEQELERIAEDIRAAYRAFNRGDIDSAVRFLDAQVEWIEPDEFPGGGTYHGVEAVRQYLAQSRASASQVISEPEKLIPAGNRVVVFVHARVMPKESSSWEDIRLADVFTFENGRVTNMRAFADREEAMRWVGAGAPAK